MTDSNLYLPIRFPQKNAIEIEKSGVFLTIIRRDFESFVSTFYSTDDKNKIKQKEWKRWTEKENIKINALKM